MRIRKYLKLLTPKAEINAETYPSREEVLRNLLYELKVENNNVKESARKVVNKVLPFWDKARCPTQSKDKCKTKVIKLYNEFRNLKRLVNMINASKHEENFMDSLKYLFEIDHADALALMENEDDKQKLLAEKEKAKKGNSAKKKLDEQFLLLPVVKEKGDKRGKKLDKIATVQREKRKKERACQQAVREQKAKLEAEKLSEKVTLSGESSQESKPSSQGSIYDPGPSWRSRNIEHGGSGPNDPPPKRGRLQLINEELSATLDRTKTTNRKATFILGKAAKAFGMDVKKLTINETSIRRRRAKLRKKSAQRIQNDFSPKGPLTVHMDGKLLPSLTGQKKVDRLPILVSGYQVDQLLSVPALSSGTGILQAEAVCKAIQDWNISDQVKALCSDTTSSNTGVHKGAFVYVQRFLGKPLLYYACRRHVPELVFKSACTSCIGKRNRPENQIFTKFRDIWEEINPLIYKTALKDPAILKEIISVKTDVIEFCFEQLTSYHPREDYQEFLELVIIFCGEKPRRGVRFRKPGAISDTRWMAKALYCLKMFMFQEQFEMSEQLLGQISDMCIFTIRIYVRYWFEAPAGILAPKNDLNLLIDLIAYKNVNAAVSDATLKTFSNHLWYLSEELVSFAFFDVRVPANTKIRMIKAMNKEGPETPAKRAIVDLQTLKEKKNISLDYFVTSNSVRFFDMLDIPKDFLSTHPSEWNKMKTYQDALKIVRSVKVTNDNAERGVALISAFNDFTKNEDQKQFLLLTVKEHLKKNPSAAKKYL